VKTKDKPKLLHALHRKDTNQPSVHITGTRMLTEAQAARLNEDVLAQSVVEWRPLPDDQQGSKARDALARSAK
jgi:hypothetical protein